MGELTGRSPENGGWVYDREGGKAESQLLLFEDRKNVETAVNIGDTLWIISIIQGKSIYDGLLSYFFSGTSGMINNNYIICSQIDTLDRFTNTKNR